MEVSGQLHAPPALLPGKSLWYPLDRRLGGPQSHSGHGGDEEKNSQSLPGIEPYNPDLPNFCYETAIAELCPCILKLFTVCSVRMDSFYFIN
jgi:hypothetical protein